MQAVMREIQSDEFDLLQLSHEQHVEVETTTGLVLRVCVRHDASQYMHRGERLCVGPVRIQNGISRRKRAYVGTAQMIIVGQTWQYGSRPHHVTDEVREIRLCTPEDSVIGLVSRM